MNSLDSYKIRLLPYCNYGPCFMNVDHPNKKYFTMQNHEQIVEYFLPEGIHYEFVNQNEPANLCLTTISLTDHTVLRKNECNIMICVENMKQFTWYPHYNKYGEYNNPNINIYIYSHIDKIVKTEKYLAIPAIYCRMNYFKQKYDFYKNHVSLNCPFQNKKFCLMMNKSNLNQNIGRYRNMLSKIGKVDTIDDVDNKTITLKSCYNSIEFLSILNSYKFVICFENSYSNGYITEKIFNCFFAKTIPLYSGSPIISRFFDANAFIELNNNNYHEHLELITKISNDEEMYNNYINHNKINATYDDENYKEEFMNYANSVF